MIGYTTLGTNNLAKASAFYDELFVILGAKRIMADDHITLWGNKPGSGMFGVITPYDEKAATVGNGVMVALSVPDSASIEKLHAKALALGASDEGAPGPRGNNMFFAYVRDLDGNKLAFYCRTK
jgi:catechol 2,3-dioxygenase-like lactoylglutathione lyase family enzyme